MMQYFETLAERVPPGLAPIPATSAAVGRGGADDLETAQPSTAPAQAGAAGRVPAAPAPHDRASAAAESGPQGPQGSGSGPATKTEDGTGPHRVSASATGPVARATVPSARPGRYTREPHTDDGPMSPIVADLELRPDAALVGHGITADALAWAGSAPAGAGARTTSAGFSGCRHAPAPFPACVLAGGEAGAPSGTAAAGMVEGAGAELHRSGSACASESPRWDPVSRGRVMGAPAAVSAVIA